MYKWHFQIEVCKTLMIWNLLLYSLQIVIFFSFCVCLCAFFWTRCLIYFSASTSQRVNQSGPELRQLCTLNHLESQVQTCLCIGTASEYKFWLHTYVRFLVQEGKRFSYRLYSMLFYYQNMMFYFKVFCFTSKFVVLLKSLLFYFKVFCSASKYFVLLQSILFCFKVFCSLSKYFVLLQSMLFFFKVCCFTWKYVVVCFVCLQV